ncbi:hypothetical protein [Neolewinella agarilytica]|uniref:hypothetical protein n=1 Tax=Neolewinella agarilytica TaxID=478744 RepID=UPI002354E2EB|nr:hypothetical protein [Neolewinella agarilytica]
MPKKNIIETVVLVGILGAGIYLSNNAKAQIDECSIPAVAKVLYTTKLHAKSPTVKFTYTIDNEEYSATLTIPNSYKRSDMKVGRSIVIVVSCDDHSISEIVDPFTHFDPEPKSEQDIKSE